MVAGSLAAVYFSGNEFMPKQEYIDRGGYWQLSTDLEGRIKVAFMVCLRAITRPSIKVGLAIFVVSLLALAIGGDPDHEPREQGSAAPAVRQPPR
jgi:hypothetical protein